MVSGGARARSGPAPDPRALRRDRADDASWITLPAEGFSGEVPVCPLPDMSDAELGLWVALWKKPQAAMWARMGLDYEVAAYVRAFLESIQPDASAGLKTAVLRMAAEIGLSLPGMHSLRWKLGADELAAKRQAQAPARKGPSAKERLAALQNGA